MAFGRHNEQADRARSSYRISGLPDGATGGGGNGGANPINEHTIESDCAEENYETIQQRERSPQRGDSSRLAARDGQPTTATTPEEISDSEDCTNRLSGGDGNGGLSVRPSRNVVGVKQDEIQSAETASSASIFDSSADLRIGADSISGVGKSVGMDSSETERIDDPDVYLKSAVEIHVANTRQQPQVVEPESIDSAFNYESQLFRLETYKDKHGKQIAKRVVRFVKRRTGENIGQVTEETAEKLKRRPGKGRTAKSRLESERNRLLAESLAKRLRRAKRGRRSNARHARE